MKAWLDYIPLFVFFITFKVAGIFPATQMLVLSSLLVYGGMWAIWRKLEKGQWFTFIATLAFGGLTLLLHNETWLKWKAPVINWVFALAFLGSMFIGQQTLAQRMLGQALDMPAVIWRRLNLAWVGFFLFAGAANAFVAFHFPRYWVDFKVFGSLGMTLAFLVGQMLLLSRYIKHEESN